MLREASLRRLDLLIKNQRDLASLDDNNVAICPTVESSNVIPSGLGTLEKHHIKQWVKGITSGRQCLLALFDARNIEGNNSNNLSLLSHGSQSISTELVLLSKSVDLHEVRSSSS